jgi:hypothetical protein
MSLRSSNSSSSSSSQASRASTTTNEQANLIKKQIATDKLYPQPAFAQAIRQINDLLKTDIQLMRDLERCVGEQYTKLKEYSTLTLRSLPKDMATETIDKYEYFRIAARNVNSMLNIHFAEYINLFVDALNKLPTYANVSQTHLKAVDNQLQYVIKNIKTGTAIVCIDKTNNKVKAKMGRKMGGRRFLFLRKRRGRRTTTTGVKIFAPQQKTLMDVLCEDDRFFIKYMNQVLQKDIEIISKISVHTKKNIGNMLAVQQLAENSITDPEKKKLVESIVAKYHFICIAVEQIYGLYMDDFADQFRLAAKAVGKFQMDSASAEMKKVYNALDMVPGSRVVNIEEFLKQHLQKKIVVSDKSKSLPPQKEDEKNSIIDGFVNGWSDFSNAVGRLTGFTTKNHCCAKCKKLIVPLHPFMMNHQPAAAAQHLSLPAAAAARRRKKKLIMAGKSAWMKQQQQPTPSLQL